MMLSAMKWIVRIDWSGLILPSNAFVPMSRPMFATDAIHACPSLASKMAGVIVGIFVTKLISRTNRSRGVVYVFHSIVFVAQSSKPRVWRWQCLVIIREIVPMSAVNCGKEPAEECPKWNVMQRRKPIVLFSVSTSNSHGHQCKTMELRRVCDIISFVLWYVPGSQVWSRWKSSGMWSMVGMYEFSTSVSNRTMYRSRLVEWRRVGLYRCIWWRKVVE